MKISSHITIPLFSLILVVGASFSATAAVEMNGTFGFVPFGDITYTGSDLAHASSVSLPANELVNTVPQFFNGKANDFFSAASAIPTFSQVTLNLSKSDPLSLDLSMIGGSFSTASLANFIIASTPALGHNGTTPGDRYSFELLEIMKSTSTGYPLYISGIGVLHDSAGQYLDTPAALNIGFTQTESGTINASLTVATTAVPEPGTIATGCCALGFLLLAGARSVSKPTV
jgi:hypothetical protein